MCISCIKIPSAVDFEVRFSSLMRLLEFLYGDPAIDNEYGGFYRANVV